MKPEKDDRVREDLSYQMVKAVMHRNFFGPEEWKKFFSVRPTKRVLKAAAKFPWSAEVLNSPCPFANSKEVLVRDTHIAFLGLDRDGHPLKSSRLADQYMKIGSVHFGINPDRLTKQTCDLRWYLMPIQPKLWVGGSDDWKSRLSHLPDGYEQSYFVEELVKAMSLRAMGIDGLEEDDSVSYGCKDELDHGQVAELCVTNPMSDAGPDFKLLPAWPASGRSYAAGDNRYSSPPCAVGVSRKLPS